MSHEINTEYAENASEDVHYAVKEGNFDLAENIAEATKLSGFTRLSEEMYKYIEQEKGIWNAESGSDDFTHADGIEN